MIVEIPTRQIAVGDRLYQSGEWFVVKSVEPTREGMSIFILTDLGLVRYGADTYQQVKTNRVQDVVSGDSSDLAKQVTVIVLQGAIDVIESLGHTLPARGRGRADAVAVLRDMIRATTERH